MLLPLAVAVGVEEDESDGEEEAALYDRTPPATAGGVVLLDVFAAAVI